LRCSKEHTKIVPHKGNSFVTRKESLVQVVFDAVRVFFAHSPGVVDAGNKATCDTIPGIVGFADKQVSRNELWIRDG
jgi:hypothetical protein